MKTMLRLVFVLMGLCGVLLILVGIAGFGTSIVLPGLGLIVSGGFILLLGFVLTALALVGLARLKSYR